MKVHKHSDNTGRQNSGSTFIHVEQTGIAIDSELSTYDSTPKYSFSTHAPEHGFLMKNRERIQKTQEKDSPDFLTFF